MTHPLDAKPAWAKAGHGKAMQPEPKPENVVPASRIDRVHGPVLHAPTTASARPGADDHKRHASRGLRC